LFILDQIELFTCPFTATNKGMFWLTLSLMFYIAVVIAVNIAFVFQERILAGLLTFSIIMIPTIFILRMYKY